MFFSDFFEIGLEQAKKKIESLLFNFTILFSGFGPDVREKNISRKHLFWLFISGRGISSHKKVFLSFFWGVFSTQLKWTE